MKRRRRLITGITTLVKQNTNFLDILENIEKGYFSTAKSMFYTADNKDALFSKDFEDWYVVRLYEAALSLRQFYTVSPTEGEDVRNRLYELTQWDAPVTLRWVVPVARLLHNSLSEKLEMPQLFFASKLARPKLGEPILKLANI